MAKRRQNPPRRETPPPAQQRGVDTFSVLVLVGLVAVGAMSLANWREVDDVERRLQNRLQRVETQVSQIVENAASTPAPQARRGPDPDRVYPIKTAGGPVKGKAGAPITIAEFSDFQ